MGPHIAVSWRSGRTGTTKQNCLKFISVKVLYMGHQLLPWPSLASKPTS